MCSLFSVFTLFYLILENMSTNVRKFRILVIFDTCDVVYNWSISLLPPILYSIIYLDICVILPIMTQEPLDRNPWTDLLQILIGEFGRPVRMFLAWF